MTMTISNNSSAKRVTVQIPTSSGDAIEAWVYLPGGSGLHPAVVMAHGIGGIKAGGLAPFAERFREEGFAASSTHLLHPPKYRRQACAPGSARMIVP
jgi:uncharacterized protein